MGLRVEGLSAPHVPARSRGPVRTANPADLLCSLPTN
jgi:hypothetical protein